MRCPIYVVRSSDNSWATDIPPTSQTLQRRRGNQNIKPSEGRSKRKRDCYSSSAARNSSSLVNHWRLVAASMKLVSFLSAAPRVRASFAKSLTYGGRRSYSLPHQPRTSAFISNAMQGPFIHKIPSISPSSASTARSYTSKNKPEEYDDLSSYDATFNLSGYQRPKVNWYPGHIAK